MKSVSFSVTLEEIDDAEEAIDALFRIAGTGEVVAGVGIADVFDGAAEFLKGAVHHFGLGNTGAQVGAGVDDHEWGFDLIDVGEG